MVTVGHSGRCKCYTELTPEEIKQQKELQKVGEFLLLLLLFYTIFSVVKDKFFKH